MPADDDTTLIQSRSALFVLQEKTLSLLPTNDGRQNAGFSFAAGDVVDQKYEILELLGEGGMGAVYKAHHKLLDKIVALKTFKTSQIDEETIARFQREARALAKLSHPNVVQIFDYGTTESKMPYYTMEFLEGESLADLLKREGRLRVSETIAIFFQVCHGLSAAHLKGILHRDLKPSNIFLTKLSAKQYKVSVVDFGLAVMTASQADELGMTMQGVICGSPLYMSPEQGRAEPLTVASDIYSLGCSLYECLTGEAPIVGSNSLQTLIRRDTEIAPTLTDNGAGKIFAPELEKIVATMLQRDASRRQPSIEIVLDDLDYFARSRKKARRQSAAQVADRTMPAAGPATEDASGRRPNKLLWASIAIFFFGCTLLIWSSLFMQKPAQLAVGQAATVMPSAIAPSGAKPVCSMSKDNKISIIEWPGHLIGKELDQPTMQKDRLTWDDTQPHCISFSEEFLADPRNLLTLRPLRVRKIFFQKQLAKSQLTEVLQNLRGQKYLNDMHFEQQLLDDNDMRLLAEFEDLTDLTMTRATGVSKKALAQLALKKQLHAINCDFSGPISDLVRVLPADKQLFCLSVNGCPVTKQDLKDIAAIPHMNILRFEGCNLTDEKLKLLTPLTHLWTLRLEDNPLTPSCIPTFEAWAQKTKPPFHKHFEIFLSGNDSWKPKDIEYLNRVVPDVHFNESENV